MKPSVVVFDLGKVLLDFDYTIAARRLAAASAVAGVQIKSFIDHSPLLVRYEKGQVTRDAFFEEVRQMSGYRGSAEEFFGYFADVFTPINAMIEFQQRLRSAGVPTFIFSNTNDLAIEHIRAQYPFFNGFDGYVLSYEHGAMKPEPKLYEVLEAMVGCDGTQILYFDDRLENVEGGATRGWNAVLHQTPEQSIAAARALGL
jgi:HAD superfamily hydrolase (TIGR01509 family)